MNKKELKSESVKLGLSFLFLYMINITSLGFISINIRNNPILINFLIFLILTSFIIFFTSMDRIGFLYSKLFKYIENE